MIRGRFAPSPTGRMHLGNLFTALLSWLSVRSRGGSWLLRIEDLDPQRSRPEYARQLEDDLSWLGLNWDEHCVQSLRHDRYEEALERLKSTGRTYPCTCTRADLRASSAPHLSDGRMLYPGNCRPEAMPCVAKEPPEPHATRLWVGDEEVEFTDALYGPQTINLARECGDFVLRRADGAWAYQLAVVVDDGEMGVTEVMRGSDLLASSAQQIYLARLLGFTPPEYHHVPLITDSGGVRLSKRHASLAMDALRERHSPESLLGRLAHLGNLSPTAEPVSLKELLGIYNPAAIPPVLTLPLAD